MIVLLLAVIGIVVIIAFIAIWFNKGQPAALQPVSKFEIAPERRYETIDVPRFDDNADPAPFSWKPCHPSTVRRFKAQMICPRGHGLVLKNHSIDTNGDVRPSVVCLTNGCDFHEIVRLADWDLGPLP